MNAAAASKIKEGQRLAARRRAGSVRLRHGPSCRKLDQAIWVVVSPSDRLTTNVVDDPVSLMAMMYSFNGLSTELS
jgi:hypothetical protein